MMARTDRREGRGRLSSIDLLPEEAEEDVVWALEQLRETRLPQNTILMEFNERLADKGLEPISKSAWNRFAVRKAIQFRRIDEVQRISGELVKSLDPDTPDQVTVLVSELVKIRCFELLEGKDLGSKELMEVARANSSAVGAQMVSADHRRKLEDEFDKRMVKVADKAEEIAREAGLSADRVAQLRRDFLGVRVAPPK